MSEGIELARPWVLAAALPLLLLYGWLRARRQRRAALPYGPLQYRPASGHRALLAKLRLPLELLVLAAVLLGLAGPYRATRLDLIEDEGIDVVLVLDISLSMLATDFPPNRLDALRVIAGDFIRRAGSHRLGIVAFAKDAFVQSPLTTDHRVLLALLEGVKTEAIDQAKSGGTAIGDALLVAADRLRKDRVEGRDQAIVLITDGESNEGADPELAARFAAQVGVRVHAIGIGGDEPVPVMIDGEPLGGDDIHLTALDETQLRSVTELANGRFYRATDVGTLEQVFAELSRLESAPLEMRQLEIRQGLASRLALAALLLYAGHLWLAGVVTRRPLR